jgi:hypothetical protein
MNKFEIFRVEKLKTMASVKKSGLHTFREIDVKNAVPERAKYNLHYGAKSADDLMTAVQKRIDTVTNVDKQAVRCLEYIVTASPEQFDPAGLLGGPRKNDYFNDALKFLREKHGAENVISVSVHMDEKSPHLVVYAVPIVQVQEKIRKRSVGQKGGGRRLIEQVVPAHSELSCKAFYGEPKALGQLQDDFHAAVGAKHGLDRGISKVAGREHKKTAKYYAEKEEELKQAEQELVKKKKALADLDAEFQKLSPMVSKLRDFGHISKGKSDDQLLTMLIKGNKVMRDIEEKKKVVPDKSR